MRANTLVPGSLTTGKEEPPMEKEYFPFNPESLALATLELSKSGLDLGSPLGQQVRDNWDELLSFLTLPDGTKDWGAVRVYFWNHVSESTMTNAYFEYATESILIDLCGTEEAYKGSETIFYPWCKGF